MSELFRILVIDDDVVDRLAIRRAIEQSDLNAVITEGGTAAEALALVAQGFDCLLFDHDLPGATGTQLTRQLRAAGNHTPIVLITGQQNEEVLQAAVEAGITDFFPKSDLSARRVALRIRFAIRIGRAEAQSQSLLDAATLASRARDDVLAVVSHDLRGPLHVIGMACEALRTEIEGAPLRYLGAIERASARAERLIKDLLDASLIENGGIALERGAIDAGAMVKQATSDHELLAKEAGATITARLPDGRTLVSADRDRVLQVIANLIGNALKHAKGSPIEISLERNEREAIIAVRDAGPGIGAAELPHVFDRYWHGRTKKSGAGLGLAIAKGIVAAHGGNISVVSTKGAGAVFSFTLPLAPARAE